MAIQRLPKPTKEEEKISVEVNDYAAYFVFKHKTPSSEDSPPVTNSFSTITLVSVRYSYEDKEEFQWELATEIKSITDADRLAWVVENFAEFLPAGYNGDPKGRYEGFLRTDERNFVEAVDTAILKEREVKL